MARKFIAIAIATLLSIGVAGCRSPLTASGFTVESHNKDQISQGSKLLAEHVAITDVKNSSRDGLLLVTIMAANLTNKDFQCEYQYTWYDGEGHRLETAMSVWKPATFHEKTSVDMSGIAPSRNATDYKLVLRFRTSSLKR